jgi:UDP-N-acetyl-D-mannosaminuronic acid dehydrogenase
MCCRRPLGRAGAQGGRRGDPRIDLAGRHHRDNARPDRRTAPGPQIPGISRETPDISIAYCPERVLPGKILEELTNNDRSIGGITPRCARKALAFYKRFVRGTCVTTDARSAEMTKLVENAYRDVNIAFANELSIMADAWGWTCGK